MPYPGVLQAQCWGVEGLGPRPGESLSRKGSLDLGGSPPTLLPVPITSVTHHLAPRHRPAPCCWPFLAQPWTSPPPRPSRAGGLCERQRGTLAGPSRRGQGTGSWQLAMPAPTLEHGREPAGHHAPGKACEDGPRAPGSEGFRRKPPSPALRGREGLLSAAAPPTPQVGCAA